MGDFLLVQKDIYAIIIGMIFGRKTLFSAVTLLSIIGYGVFVFAIAPSGGYAPGETLDPVGCSPGTPDCKVNTTLSAVLNGTPQTHVKYEQTNNFLGLGIPGAGQVWDSGTGGVSLLATMDATTFGGSKNSTYVGYLTTGGSGANANLFTFYDDANDQSQASLFTSNLSGNQAGIEINAKTGGTNVQFKFGGLNFYRFPSVAPSSGQFLGYTGANQLGWVTPSGGGGGSMSIGSTIGGSATDEVLYTDSLGLLNQSSNFTFDGNLNVFKAGTSFGTAIKSNNGGGMGNLVELGDVLGTKNKTKFGLYDGTHSIIGALDGDFKITNSAGTRWFDADTVNNVITLGDVSGAANKTKLKIDDINKQFWVNLDGEFTIRDTLDSRAMIVDTTNKSVMMGDFDGSNRANLMIYPGSQQIIGAAKQGIILGDYYKTGTGTLFTVDDSAQSITASSSVHGASGVGLNLDFASNIYELGQVSGGTGNHTRFTINDDLSKITSIGSVYDVQNQSGNLLIHAEDVTGPIVKLGDLSDSVHGTKLWVVDDSQAIRFQYGSGAHSTYTFPIGDGAAGQVLSTDGTGQISWTTPSQGITGTVADQAIAYGTSGSTLGYTGAFTFRQSDSRLKITDGLSSIFEVNNGGAGAIGGIGDVENMHFGTRILINDTTAKSVSINANNAIQVGDVSGLYNKTRLTIDDSIGLIIEQINNTTGGYVIKNNLGKRFFNVDAGSKQISIGDLDSAGSSTALYVQDSSTNITAQLAGQFIVGSPAGPTWFNVNVGAQTVSLGDLSGPGNGTKISIDDANSRVRFDFGGDFYDFPVGDGSSNYLLATNGSGQLFWQDPTLVPSDRTLKSNITPINYGLDTLMQLNPVSYTLNSNGKEQIGFIAQDVEQLVPELVGDVGNGKKGLAYGQMSALIVKSMQQLDLKITDIENFATAQDQTFLQSIIAWLGNTANGIGDLFASRVNTHELCVDGQCLNQDDVRQLLELKNSMPGNNSSGTTTPPPATDPQSDPVTSPENPAPQPAPEVVPDPTAGTSPEVIPESNPEPAPQTQPDSGTQTSEPQ